MEKNLLKLLDYFFMVSLWTSKHHSPFPVQGVGCGLFVYIGKLKRLVKILERIPAIQSFRWPDWLSFCFGGFIFFFTFHYWKHERRHFAWKQKIRILQGRNHWGWTKILAGAVIWLKYMEDNILWHGLNF